MGFSMGYFFPPHLSENWCGATWISLIMWDFFSTKSRSQQDSTAPPEKVMGIGRREDDPFLPFEMVLH